MKQHASTPKIFPRAIFAANGITFVELLVTVTVATMILLFAVPYFKHMIMDKRMMTARDALINGLNYARNTALTQNATIQACPIGSSGSTTCGTNWSSGFMVVSQPASGGKVLLQSYRAGTNAPTLSVVPISGVSASTITFDSRGITTTQAYFKLCDSRGGAYATSVQVLPTGLVQTAASVGTAVWNGGALTCP